ncbi:hypothetical protein SUSAZ_08510 [Sulfolobus acidocaldarius SUSAZ]|nr:hypothetical protein SUSAZ_08510 [Sulfolobus acidocaldarius SUSAZ]
MPDSKTIGFVIVAIILLVIAAVGFYEYSVVSSNYTSLQNSYTSLSSTLSQAQANASYFMKLAEENYTNYQKLLSNYTTLENMYSALLKQKVSAQYTEGSALANVFKMWDGIAIESPGDVTPYLASNFTATISGVPFPGTYNLQTFNSSWLSNFFSDYETVYFYTTELPKVTQMSNTSYQISAVVQYFVAPTQDPIYLQVFNASVTLVVQIINGVPEITSMNWVGNEVSPSAVISGYPSQHLMQANQVAYEVLSEVNGLGAEFAPNVISQYFSPNAVLNISGVLPQGLSNGTYTGLTNIQNFFNNWDKYFIFVVEYSQNLLPNGTAIPPSIKVTLLPNETMAVVTANVTPIIGFVNQGEPTFPGIYDLHISLTAYLMYNSTAGMWQIVKENWNVNSIPSIEDTLFYNINQPIFKVIKESTITVNASTGGIVQAGNIVSIVQPGTYAELPNGTLLSVYNFSLVLFSVQGVYPPPLAFFNYTPSYAFAFALNGKISPAYSFVNSSKVSKPIITIVYGSNTWTSWTWLGGSFNGTAYVGGSYKFPDKWIYGNNVMVNTQFFKPVLWIFETGQNPLAIPPTPSNVSVTKAFGLTPINAYSYQVNGMEGGVITAGNIMVVIKPGTIIHTPTANLTNYNFSVVFYSTNGLPNSPSGEVPFIAFAYAINGNVTFSYSASQSFITIVSTPDNNGQMWTWGPPGYILKDSIILGNGIMVNLTFFKPVPWIITLPTLTSSSSTTSSSTSSMSTSSSSTSSSTTSTTSTTYTSTTSTYPY